MNTNNLIVTLLTVPVIAGAYFGSAVLSQVTADECNAEIDLQGTVSRNEATVTNHSQNDACVYDATLAVYDSPKEPETYGWIEAQTLIGSKSVKVKAGETVTLKVEGNGPSCNAQADLIRGTEVLTPPVYRNAMDVDVYKTNEGKCTTTEVTPTPESKVGGVSATNTTVNKLAATGDAAATYGFILAGALSLLAGFFLRKTAK